MAEVYQEQLFPTEKQCSKCAETKPFSEFHRGSKRADRLSSRCKPCAKLMAKEWARANPLRRKQIRDKYIANNKKRLANVESISEKVCSYCGCTKKFSEFFRHDGCPFGLTPRCRTCISFLQRDYREKRQEQIAVAKRLDHVLYPEKQRIRNRRRRARMLAASGEVDGEEWRAKLDSYDGKCHWCRKPVSGPVQMEHVMPLCLGGSHTIDNVVPSCKTCNLRKGKRHPDEWIKILEAEGS